MTFDEIAATRKAAKSVGGIGSRASEPIAEYVIEAADETEAYLDSIVNDDGDEVYDTSDFKSAGAKVASICEEEMRGYEASTQPAPRSPKPKPQPQPQPVTVPGDGTFEVGRDIPPGTYRNQGSIGEGYSCVAYASSKPNDLNTYLRGSTSKGPAILAVYPVSTSTPRTATGFHEGPLSR